MGALAAALLTASSCHASLRSAAIMQCKPRSAPITVPLTGGNLRDGGGVTLLAPASERVLTATCTRSIWIWNTYAGRSAGSSWRGSRGRELSLCELGIRERGALGPERARSEGVQPLQSDIAAVNDACSVVATWTPRLPRRRTSPADLASMGAGPPAATASGRRARRATRGRSILQSPAVHRMPPVR